jgi:hypothetical protein
MMLGVIHSVDGHFIATKLFAFLIPSGSMYVTDMQVSRYGNRTQIAYQGIPIKTQWLSVILGIVRVWPWFLGFAWPFLLAWGQNVNAVPSWIYYSALGWFALALLALIPGRLSKKDKSLRRHLGELTGMRLDPAQLLPGTRETTKYELERRMTDASLPITAAECEKAAATLSPDVLPLLYAYARYAGDEADWRAVADAAAQRLPLI